MTPAGQNYPIHEHTFLFWGLYLGAVIAFTFLALGLFVVMVHRTSQATRTAPPVDSSPERDGLEVGVDRPAHLHAA